MKAAGWALGSLVSVVGFVALGSHGDAELAFAGTAAGLACVLLARFERRRARRARIGALSERRVRAALGPLERAGWTVRHSVRWPQGGDIDHIATAPTGAAFVIETKTQSFSSAHLARTRACASWVTRRRRRWATSGAAPVLCVVHGHLQCVVMEGVLVVPVDRLTGVLRSVVKAQECSAAIPVGEIVEARGM
jgi:hypothetical protein